MHRIRIRNLSVGFRRTLSHNNILMQRRRRKLSRKKEGVYEGE
jgi:hypothetical protein